VRRRDVGFVGKERGRVERWVESMGCAPVKEGQGPPEGCEGCVEKQGSKNTRRGLLFGLVAGQGRAGASCLCLVSPLQPSANLTGRAFSPRVAPKLGDN